MIHRIVWRVASTDALDFWEKRLGEGHRPSARRTGYVRDPEGLELELGSSTTADEPLVADHPEIPRELALQGFDEVRAFARRRTVAGRCSRRRSDSSRAATTRGRPAASAVATVLLRRPPAEPGLPGAGTVHHVAWASQRRTTRRGASAIEAGATPTPVIDRFWFQSIYFREPSGVLFESPPSGPASLPTSPEHLGERLLLPP